ncbi:MAG TPA: response regulator [Holophaga sp.]|nr:response regulator [Holophaga sp.]HPS66690.1 response regulator [Holophaga sp.]
MKRILVADDERPVIESISLIVKRELSGQFEIAGHAMSGKDAIERAAALSPDIILMDVRMPGISGLDAIREIRKRGSAAAFILVTAYERFDIARDAVELGVIDYLLKPVAKERLAQALKRASDALERRGELERGEIEHREREETMRAFVEAAFLHGIMLGERFGSDLPKYRAVLGLPEPFAMVAVAAFLPSHGSPRPDDEMASLHGRFRATVRYKTQALAGPLVAGHALVLVPLRDVEAGAGSLEDFRSVLAQAHAEDLEKGHLRIGFGGARPFEDLSASWTEAMGDLLGCDPPRSRAAGDDRPFELDEAFLEALLEGSPERARLSLERLLGPMRDQPALRSAERCRFIALFGAAGRTLARKGLLDEAEAMAMLDMEDLRSAEAGPAFALAVHARFSRLAAGIGRAPRWSPLVSRAVAFVRENYGKPMSLESTAWSLGISPNRLSRLFGEEMGKGFSDYLIEYRIDRAKELLVVPGASIKHVSFSCGYPDPNYFSRLFKKVTGLTPTTFISGSPEAPDGNG